MIGDARGDPRTLDGPWMTEALERAGVARGATVTDVHFDGLVGTGQMSRNARFTLTWDDPDNRPATVIGKFPTDDPSTRASSFKSGVYFSECSFYDELAATVDIRPDNFLLGRADGAPPLAVVDWQTIFKGLGVIDVAYLIGGSLEPAGRRAHERDLVEEYRAHLSTAGIDYSSDDCWRDYRWGTLHGVIICVCAAMMAEQTERGDDMLTLMGTRHARHALDLDALSLLDDA
jgi:hypothetical protein